jgi:hypothetical protein
MSIFSYRIKANNGFRDGNVYPKAIPPGSILIVDEVTYKKMLQSDPDGIELIEKVVPNPKQVKKEE